MGLAPLFVAKDCRLRGGTYAVEYIKERGRIATAPVENSKAAKHRGVGRKRREAPPGVSQFIRTQMHLVQAPVVPEILLFTTHQGASLSSLVGSTGGSPYWAFPWAGGLALARHILDCPELVAGRSVLDLGTGSGLVAIAAVKAGARAVSAADTDPIALSALKLNAAVNNVEVTPIGDDLLDGSPPEVHVVLAGDLFYAQRLARRVTAFLDRCVNAGIEVLVGDPRRAHLPLARLRLIAEYDVPDVGEAKGALKRAGVFAFLPNPVQSVGGSGGGSLRARSSHKRKSGSASTASM
jgi:predicted nicotinamide N-methyase